MEQMCTPPRTPSPSDRAVTLDSIALHAPTLLTALGPDGTIQYQSPSVTRLFGYDPDRLAGESIADYCHPDDRQRVVDAVERLVSADEQLVESVEYRHKRSDGTYLWVESVGESMPTPAGYYVLNTRDISERKRREQELEAATERLEQFGRFVAHDLRNPLSVAQGHLELAAEAAPSEHHEPVANALDRMEALIRGLRRESRGDRGTNDHEPVALSGLCTSCWGYVSTAESTLEVGVERSIFADRFRLMQLLENLFRNAVEHNDERVRITVGELDDGFYIADDGCGIPEPERDSVFETGYTTAADGTGYGLDIVGHVVDAHGWSIAITESDAGGARFEITGVRFATAESASASRP